MALATIDAEELDKAALSRDTICYMKADLNEVALAVLDFLEDAKVSPPPPSLAHLTRVAAGCPAGDPPGDRMCPVSRPLAL